ncbi:hypothetical protein [Dictyobacter vulcani]|uniref:hypothetical protein n=1 Tax=Dictyobacter vulcani TaxID=2607529 RepID=UPI0013866BE0|nr:hypothetical protein [Dictyobacter vulcani]
MRSVRASWVADRGYAVLCAQYWRGLWSPVAEWHTDRVEVAGPTASLAHLQDVVRVQHYLLSEGYPSTRPVYGLHDCWMAWRWSRSSMIRVSIMMPMSHSGGRRWPSCWPGNYNYCASRTGLLA